MLSSYLFKVSGFLFLFLLNFPIQLISQNPLIIDHRHTVLEELPLNWVDSAKINLNIGYGHTSHGSQLTSGMKALNSFFTDGRFNWSHNGGEGKLHLFEGDGYGNGYLDHDCGYSPWSAETREYLEDFPDCNVIIWSWCGQVNSVDLPSHYFEPMQELENDFPNVTFVYMTGHLEGQGPNGSLNQANQKIRDYCTENNKVLFDFADIEKYDPDAQVNYQEHYANDACNYNHPDGGTANWASDWINNNPDHELTQITQHCSSCAHSHPLNCVRKGIAIWYLCTRLAGWNGILTNSKESSILKKIQVYPNPAEDHLNLDKIPDGSTLKILDLQGRQIYKEYISGIVDQLNISFLERGLYLVEIYTTEKQYYINKMIKL